MTLEELNIRITGTDNVDHAMSFKQVDSGFPIKEGNREQMLQQSQQSVNGMVGETAKNETEEDMSSLATIAILKRHPMYDCLVLVKRYRASCNGYTLEFPTSERTTNRTKKNQSSDNTYCSKTKLVSIYLDGDDPIYRCQEKNCKNSNLSAQDGEIVYVPMNGLLDRFDTYDKRGITVDSRVYAFAMGLKTAERIMRTNSMKEVQETPQI